MNELKAPPLTRERIDSIDMLRGLVMVVMALDHVRDFFTNAYFDPTDLQKTTPAYFFTRWITHYCAPTFIFLAGTSAYLFRLRGKSAGQLSWLLFSRGLWLAVFELTIDRVLWLGRFDPIHHGAGVFWAIALSMMAMAALVRLPTAFVGAFGVAMIATHNLLDKYSAADYILPPWLWMILHQPGDQPIGWGLTFGTGYCFIPWVGVMAAGYAFGSLFRLDAKRRTTMMAAIGVSLMVGFVALRYLNRYGDASRWSVQPNRLFTVMSFLNCTKYPPSLLYLLMTLGPAVTALAIFDRFRSLNFAPVVTLGRVPLFYYALHILLIHGGAVLVDLGRFGYSPLWLNGPWDLKPERLPPGYGFGLPSVYLIWLIVLTILYPCCRWYAEFKRKSRSVLLSYL